MGITSARGCPRECCIKGQYDSLTEETLERRPFERLGDDTRQTVEPPSQTHTKETPMIDTLNPEEPVEKVSVGRQSLRRRKVLKHGQSHLFPENSELEGTMDLADFMPTTGSGFKEVPTTGPSRTDRPPPLESKSYESLLSPTSSLAQSTKDLTEALSTKMDEGYENRVAAMAGIEELEFYDVCELSPLEVLQNAFAYLKIDPDGGIMNLDETSGQFSKWPLVVPGPIKFFVAAIECFFAFYNPCCIMRNLFDVLWHFTPETDVESCSGPICFWLGISWNILTFPNLRLFFAMTEGILVLYFVACAVRLLLVAIYARCSCSPERARNQMFLCVFKFTSRAYKRLQNTSVLLGLTFWHPALIGKHYNRYFQARREAAGRFLAEKFLDRTQDVTTDDELRYSLLSVLAKCENVDGDVSETKRLIHERMHWNLVDLFNTVPSAHRLRSLGVDSFPVTIKPEVMDRRCRLLVLCYFENCAFVLVLAVVTLLTVLGFFVKIYSLYLLIDDADGAITCQVMESVFILLNQLMGCLSLNILLLERIEVFIMGGTDAVLTQQEYDIFLIYFAMLLECIWKSKHLNLLQKLVVTLTFEDDDIQHLIMEEDHGQKSAIAKGARQFLDRHISPRCCTETAMLHFFMGGNR